VQDAIFIFLEIFQSASHLARPLAFYLTWPPTPESVTFLASFFVNLPIMMQPAFSNHRASELKASKRPDPPPIGPPTTGATIGQTLILSNSSARPVELFALCVTHLNCSSFKLTGRIPQKPRNGLPVFFVNSPDRDESPNMLWQARKLANRRVQHGC